MFWLSCSAFVCTVERYDDVMALMQRTSGVSIRDADSRQATEHYLARNPGMSFLCMKAEKVAGCAMCDVRCAMCGHDGRRGYLLQHVIVDTAYRGRGIALSCMLTERTLREPIGLGCAVGASPLVSRATV